MGTRSDRERKLAADAGFTMPEFAGEPLAERTFTSTYHDTEDMRLARAGIVLRRRVEDGTQAWQLKLPRGRRRLEVDLPGDAEESPAELVELLFAHTRGMDVTAVAALRMIRSGVQVHEGERRVADVISDRLAVVEGDVVTDRPGDLEIELVDGDDEELGQIEARLRDAGARDADRRSKLERALGLARSEPPAPTDEAPTPADRLLAVVGTQYRVILANDPGTRRGDDPEYLHQHRVAVRRLRSVLRAAAPMLDAKWTRKLRDELKWAGYALGPVRDLDVMIEHLRARSRAARAVGRRAAHRLASRGARRGPRRRCSRRFARSATWSSSTAWSGRRPALPIVNTGVSLTELAAKEFRKVQKAMAALGPLPPDDQLHEAQDQGQAAALHRRARRAVRRAGARRRWSPRRATCRICWASIRTPTSRRSACAPCSPRAARPTSHPRAADRLIEREHEPPARHPAASCPTRGPHSTPRARRPSMAGRRSCSSATPAPATARPGRSPTICRPLDERGTVQAAELIESSPPTRSAASSRAPSCAASETVEPLAARPGVRGWSTRTPSPRARTADSSTRSSPNSGAPPQLSAATAT